MDIRGKLTFAQRAIESISTHEDEDAALRIAALDRLAEVCQQEKAKINERLLERISSEIEGG